MARPTDTVQTVFKDWDGNPQTLEIYDNADSISLEVKYETTDQSVQFTVGVRIRPDDLDAFEAEIARIRKSRGI